MNRTDTAASAADQRGTGGAHANATGGDARHDAAGGGHYQKMAITAAGTLGSRVLGLVRDQLTAHFLGAGATASALILAQTIPNLFRRLLGEGALTAALVPVMTDELKAGGRARAFRLLNRVLLLAAPAMAALTLVLMAAAWGFAQWAGTPLMAALPGSDGAPPLPPEGGFLGLKYWHPFAAMLTVYCLPYMPLVCLAALFTAALNIFGKFGVTSLGPLMLNVCIIAAMCAGGLWFAPGDPETLALWACGGFVAGGVAQLLSPAIALWLREGWRVERTDFAGDASAAATAASESPAAAVAGQAGMPVLPLSAASSEDERAGRPRSILATAAVAATAAAAATVPPETDPLLRLRAVFLPALAGAGVQQLNFVVSRFLAVGMDDSALSLYYYANRIVELPVGLFAVTVATVIFPAMTLCAARGEHGRMGGEFAHGMRLIFAINIPAAAGLIALCAPVVRLLFEQGRFGSADTAATLPLLCVFAAAMPFYGAIALLGRALNALQITKPQARLALVVFLFNLVLSPPLAWLAGAPGLAAANLAGAVLQAVVLWWMLCRQGAAFRSAPLGRPLLQCLGAAAAMGAVAWAAWTFAGAPVARGLGRFLLANPLAAGRARIVEKFAESLPLLAVIGAAAGLYFCLLMLLRYPEAAHLRETFRRHRRR